MREAKISVQMCLVGSKHKTSKDRYQISCLKVKGNMRTNVKLLEFLIYESKNL